MFIPENFALYELFPKDFYEKHQYHPHRMWQMYDDRVLKTIQAIRVRYGPMVANDWKWDGNHQYRGWRPWDCEFGAELSMHKWASAIDLMPVKVTAEEIRQDILADPFNVDFQHITCLELNIGWLHLDTRNWDKKKEGILLVYP